MDNIRNDPIFSILSRNISISIVYELDEFRSDYRGYELTRFRLEKVCCNNE